MQPQQLPEMLRCPLESVALRIKTLRLGRIGDFLAKAIEPPSQHAIEHVVAVLRGLSALQTTPPPTMAHPGALPPPPRAERVGVADAATHDSADENGTEELTPLGQLLARLPVDPRIGKMILFGSAVGVSCARC